MGGVPGPRPLLVRRRFGSPARPQPGPFVGRFLPPAVRVLADAVDARTSRPPDGSCRRGVGGESPLLLRLQNCPVPHGALTAAAALDMSGAGNPVLAQVPSVQRDSILHPSINQSGTVRPRNQAIASSPVLRSQRSNRLFFP